MVNRAALLAVLLAVAAPAAAQIVPCTAVRDQGQKILLDDIVASSAGADNLLQSLTSRLDANLAQVQAELGIDLKVLPCAKRRPSGPSDFTRSLVQELNVRDVVMEVWGVATEQTDAQGQRFHEASVGYVLVPVRLNEFQAQKPSGAFIVPHRAQVSAPMDDLLRLVDQSGRLGAYAALAAGSKSLRSSKWADARKQLCAAQSLFASLKQPVSAGDTELGEYARKLAGDTIAGAQGDAKYTGSLKLQPVDLPCFPTP